MDSAKVAARMSEGYTFVCAMCKNLHLAKDDGLDCCYAAVHGFDCAGPFGGGCYPHYSGPLEGNLSGYCFVCGKASEGAVDIGGKLVGVCNRHLPRLECMTEGAKRPPFLTHVHLPVLK